LSYHDARKWSGYVLVSAYVTSGHTVAELEAAIEREIGKIREGGVTAEELERAKIRAELSRVRSLKSNLGQAFRMANAVGTAGTVDYMYEYEARIGAVTAAEVQAAAARYLSPGRKCVVEVSKTPGVSGAPPDESVADAHHRGGGSAERGAKHSAGFDEAMALIGSAKPLTLKMPEVGKDVQRVVLPCGATVFVKQDRSAPSVELDFVWLGGSNTTPVSALAPFELAAELLDEGGTETLDPSALEERKEQLGMSFGFYLGQTESGAYFWSLKRNFSESFALAMDMLMRPRLDAERLETLKVQYIDDMRRRYDYPDYGAYLVQRHVLYRDHPRLGYEASMKEIQALTPEALRKVWKRYLGRDNLYITAVGDFETQEILDLLQSTFDGWRKAEDKERDYMAREPSIRPGLFLVEKEVSAPAVSLVHEVKVDRRAPLADHAALEILNDILGGSGFRSRLMERLRSDEGLTYGVYSYLAHDGRAGVPGQVGASYETKKVSVARSIASAIDEFRKLARGKVSPAEVQEQIDAWRNRFVFRFTSDFYSVDRLMHNELDDRPYDHDRRLLEAIQKVGPADVERVARKYLKPESLSISVFGTLTEEDRAALAETYGLKVLPKSEVFRGGYDAEVEALDQGPAGFDARSSSQAK
jgi:zinc protease